MIRIQLAVIILLIASCNEINKDYKSLKDLNPVGVKLESPLKVGDKIGLWGGYEYDPTYLRNPKDSIRIGTIIKFIKGQDTTDAAVVKLINPIIGDSIVGDILVLELRHDGQTWQDPSPVHIELCDFIPENIEWKTRRKGEWVEAAALIKVIEKSK